MPWFSHLLNGDNIYLMRLSWGFHEIFHENHTDQGLVPNKPAMHISHNDYNYYYSMPGRTGGINPFWVFFPPKTNILNTWEEEFRKTVKYLRPSKKTGRTWDIKHRTTCWWRPSSWNSRRLSRVAKGPPPVLILACLNQRQAAGSGGSGSAGWEL